MLLLAAMRVITGFTVLYTDFVGPIGGLIGFHNGFNSPTAALIGVFIGQIV